MIDIAILYTVYCFSVVIGLGTAYHAVGDDPSLTNRQVWTIVLIKWPFVLGKMAVNKFLDIVKNQSK